MPAKRDLRHVDATTGTAAARAVLKDIEVGAAEPIAAWLRACELASRAGWKSPTLRAFVEALASAASAASVR